jgi:hypothetical protein
MSLTNVSQSDGQVEIAGKSYTTNQARAIMAEIGRAADGADNYLASVAHQEMVAGPNPHAAEMPAAEPGEPTGHQANLREAPDAPEAPPLPLGAQPEALPEGVVADDVVERADASTPTAPAPSPLKAEEIEDDPARAAARESRENAQKRAAKRAAPTSKKAPERKRAQRAAAKTHSTDEPRSSNAP